MEKNLTNSAVDRKNILNNNLAIQEVYKQVGFFGLMFDGKYRFTKQQVAEYFDVDVRTIERIIESNKNEITESGYEVYTGAKLKHFKDNVTQFIDTSNNNFDADINVGIKAQIHDNELDIMNKTRRLAVFTYKSFLNIGMLLTGSEKAKLLRSTLLDIVIDVLNQRLGGKTKYINQREEEFLPSVIREFNYRKEFTDALDHYIVENKFKYGQLTDKIYKSIFKENAKEYRQILQLKANENVRSTMYSEVLDLIAGYENGFARFLKDKFEALGRKLQISEVNNLFATFEEMTTATLLPLKEKARSLMASRDLVFRDALHETLKEYIGVVSSEDYEKFLGEKSKDLEKRIDENRDVFTRLKIR